MLERKGYRRQRSSRMAERRLNHLRLAISLLCWITLFGSCCNIILYLSRRWATRPACRRREKA